MEFLDALGGSLSETAESLGKWKLAAIVVAVIAVAALGFYFFFSTPATGELTVQVKNAQGEPLWKASVKLTGTEGDFSGTTDRSGHAVFNGVPVGKSLTIEASGKGFSAAKKGFTLSSEKGSVALALEAEGGGVALVKTITFVGPDGMRLDRKLLTAELGCSSGMALSDPVKRVADGRLEVQVPDGCGNMSATVSGTGFETGSFSLNEASVISLSALETRDGKVAIIARDSAGRFLDGVEISITDARGAPTGDVAPTVFGEADFSLEPGNYRARAYDPSLAYDAGEAQFSVEPKGQSRVDMVLAEKPVATFGVKVIDKSTRAEVTGARIILEDAQGSGATRPYNGGTIQLGLPKAGVYKLGAAAEGYSQGTLISVNSSSVTQQPYTIELAKCTPSTCGILRISVVDEDNSPVANARVALVDSATGFYAEEYGIKYTDYSGVAKFSGAKTGRYKALVQKYPAEGSSQAFDVNAGVDFGARVSLAIGDGTIEVEAVDADGDTVPFGFAEFRSEGRDKLGKLPLDSQGKVSFATKADKRVFVTVSAQGFANYTSEGIQIYPQKTVKVRAELQKQILGDSPSVQFLGLFSENGSKAGVMAAGGTYFARFGVSVPANSLDELEQLGLFVRAGNGKLVEKEPFYIDSVNAPKASVLKGSTYNERAGKEQDEGNITNGEAKWVSVVWDRTELRQGVYIAEVEVKARESATPGVAMPLYYRAYGVDEDGRVIRDPKDAELGYGEGTGAKGALYAESYEKEFSEGAVEQCDEEFCYSERVLDKKNDVYLAAPYDLRVFGDYQFEFKIANNSQGVHDNANIRIMNSLNGATALQSLKIAAYNITNADAQTFGSSAGAYEIQPVSLGNFRQNKEVRGVLQLRPEALGQTALDMRVVSDRQQVFVKQVPLSIVNEKDMNITVMPETMPAFTRFDINVEARLYRTQDDFDEVQGAFARVERITPDRQRSVFTATTGGDGKAGLSIPASPPNTVIKVRVEKDGYAGKPFTFKVSKDIILFRPPAIKSGLDITSNNEQKLQLEATNVVPETLTVSEMYFSGGFRGLLDTQRMNNWLSQYVGKASLQHQAASQFTVLTAISEDAKRLDAPTKLGGSLVVEVTNADRSVKWPLTVSAEIGISLAEPPKEPNCIEVSIKEWKDATLGGTAEAEFYIRNTCLSQGDKPLDLRGLKAKLKWNGNKYGNVELHVTDHETGQEASETLSDGAYSTLFDTVPRGKEYTAILVFTPRGNTIGKKAEFTVVIDAGQNTSEGEQLVGASNAIDSEIDIIDLGQCIKYTPDAEAGLRIEENQTDGKLDIDSSACGNVDIEFWLCKDDKDCSGGVEGGIKVSPEQFKLTPQTPKKSLVVSRQQVPGLYGIGVFVRTPGTNYRKVGTIDVLARPTKDDAFELYKYDFSVKGAGAQDSTELTNRFFVETVAVDASVCDWGDATEKGWWDWKGAGVGAVVGALASIKPALMASHAAANGVAQGAGGALQAAKTAGMATKTTTQASVQKIQALCSQLQSSTGKVQGVTASCNANLYPEAAAAASTASAALSAASAECQKMLSAAQAAGTNAADSITNLNGQSILVSGERGKTQQGEALFSDSETGKKGQLAWEYFASGKAMPSGSETGNGNGIDKAYFASGSSGYVVPIMAGIAGAAIIIPKIITHYSANTAGVSLITAKLDAATAQMVAIQGYASARSWNQTCTASISAAVADLQQSSSAAKALGGSEIATGAAQAGTFGSSTSAAGTAVGNAGTTMTPAATASTSFLSSPKAIMGMYTLGGFFIGGVLFGLMGQDACSQRHSSALPDYMINMLSDAGPIDSERPEFSARYVADSAKIIGAYLKQRIGVVVTNSGASSPKPIYDTLTFRVRQHLHANPTKISKGTKNFGPFNLPDQQTEDIGAKIHVKLKTQEAEEQIPELDFDTVSCVSGNKIGRTGTGALPKVKLNWSFGAGGVDEESCLEQNPQGVYCDATQFTISLSKRLNALREFFARNSNLKCPGNPLTGDFLGINSDLNGSQSITHATGCYINDWSGYTDNEPTIKRLIEANKGSIAWTADIPDEQAFLDTIHFNALLMKDGYSDDFRKDFAYHYSNVQFFDTPDWFHGLARDASGIDYGVGRLFESGKVGFRNRFFDSAQLSSAGVHEVLIGLSGDDGSFRFFNTDGTANMNVKVEFYLLQEPNPNSAFYSVPFDGLVGLEGDSFNRQGYGTSFVNRETGKLVSINGEQLPMKTYSDSGSNPATRVNSRVDTGFFGLNASPSTRGNLLRLEKVSAEAADLKFSPSTATPVALRMKADTVSRDGLSAFYRITETETPVDSGETSVYWDGAGACLDNTGALVTESFDTRPDRAANPHDPLLNWESGYAVDFGPVNYTGDVYIRTVFYTDPKGQFVLSAEHPQQKLSFITPDTEGTKVQLAGVKGEGFNDERLGAAGQVKSISDIFGLVEDEKVCVVDSGRKADFFWNPKAVYGMGSQRTISGLSNSLKAGYTCIGLGG